MLLPFVGRVYCVEDNNPALILDDVTRHFVYDATVTRECWLTNQPPQACDFSHELGGGFSLDL